MSATITQKRLSFLEKAGYSLGDLAANLVFQLLMTFQFIFFTGVMGLSAGAAGMLFLIGRVFDAFTDPAMGIIADRTKSRWGRFRPWLIWSALPFAAIFWLSFTSPGWEPTAQMAYAYVMYFLLMAIYTVNNVPYCALNGVMTGNIDERTVLSSYRFVGATVAQLIIQVFTWPLVAKLGGGDDAKGWSLTVGIFAAFTIVLFVLSFLSVRERVQPDPDQHSSPRQDMLDTFRNKPWVILFCATLMIFIMLVVRGGSVGLYMEKIVDLGAMRDLLDNVGLVMPASGELGGFQKILNISGFLVNLEGGNVHNVAFAFFNLMGIPTTLLGVVLSKALSTRFGKRRVFVTCLLLTALSTCWLFFIPLDNVGLMLAQGMSWGLAYGPTIPLLWSMIGDAADYSEWTTGRRATGFVFAGVVFALKFGLGVGGFIQGMILWIYGYDAEAALTETAVMGIRLVTTIYPALFILAAASILYFYPITRELNQRIADELEARRKDFKPDPAIGA
jgi:glycoside/pentoside/hexuronide:cation symporter, GPH family